MSSPQSTSEAAGTSPTSGWDVYSYNYRIDQETSPIINYWHPAVSIHILTPDLARKPVASAGWWQRWAPSVPAVWAVTAGWEFYVSRAFRTMKDNKNKNQPLHQKHHKLLEHHSLHHDVRPEEQHRIQNKVPIQMMFLVVNLEAEPPHWTGKGPHLKQKQIHLYRITPYIVHVKSKNLSDLSIRPLVVGVVAPKSYTHGWMDIICTHTYATEPSHAPRHWTPLVAGYQHLWWHWGLRKTAGDPKTKNNRLFV